jgi:hypothetical protein
MFCCRALESLQCLRALWDEISFLGDQVTGHSTAHSQLIPFHGIHAFCNEFVIIAGWAAFENHLLCMDVLPKIPLSWLKV